MSQHQQRRDTLRKEHHQYYNRHDAVIRERNRKDAQLDRDIYDLLVACLPATKIIATAEEIPTTTTTSTTIVVEKEEDNENDQISSNKNDNSNERVQRRRRRSPTTPLTMTERCTWLPSNQHEGIKSSDNRTYKSKSNNNTTSSSSLPSSPLSRSVTFDDNVQVVMF